MPCRVPGVQPCSCCKSLQDAETTTPLRRIACTISRSETKKAVKAASGSRALAVGGVSNIGAGDRPAIPLEGCTVRYSYLQKFMAVKVDLDLPGTGSQTVT